MCFPMIEILLKSDLYLLDSWGLKLKTSEATMLARPATMAYI